MAFLPYFVDIYVYGTMAVIAAVIVVLIRAIAMGTVIRLIDLARDRRRPQRRQPIMAERKAK